MSSSPFLPKEEDEPPTYKAMCCKALKKCCMGTGCCLLLLFALAWAVQGTIFWFVTAASHCTAKDLDGYSYPGGESSDEGGASYNLVPKIALLAQRAPAWYGQAFDIIPSNEASTVADAPTGTWWRTWGPWFYTYTYEDIANSRTTVFMRQNLLRIGESHKIARCDGTGPVITFTEGSNFLSNRIRRIMGMNQGMSFHIYVDNDLVGVAEETNSGFQSLTFRTAKGEKFASSILQDRHFHGQFDEWLDKNSETAPIPYYVTEAATLLYAFHVIRIDEASKTVKHYDKGPSAFLANSSFAEAPVVEAPAAAAEASSAPRAEAAAVPEEAPKAEIAPAPEVAPQASGAPTAEVERV